MIVVGLQPSGGGSAPSPARTAARSPPEAVSTRSTSARVGSAAAGRTFISAPPSARRAPGFTWDRGGVRAGSAPASPARVSGSAWAGSSGGHTGPAARTTAGVVLDNATDTRISHVIAHKGEIRAAECFGGCWRWTVSTVPMGKQLYRFEQGGANTEQPVGCSPDTPTRSSKPCSGEQIGSEEPPGERNLGCLCINRRVVHEPERSGAQLTAAGAGALQGLCGSDILWGPAAEHRSVGVRRGY